MPTWAKITSLLTTKIKNKKLLLIVPKWKFIKELSLFTTLSLNLEQSLAQSRYLKNKRNAVLLQQIHSQSSSIAPGFNM